MRECALNTFTIMIMKKGHTWSPLVIWITSICSSSRVSGDKTDGSPAAQFAAFTTPVGLERDVRNVQEVQSLSSLPPLSLLSLSLSPIKIKNHLEFSTFSSKWTKCLETELHWLERERQGRARKESQGWKIHYMGPADTISDTEMPLTS